MFYDLAFCVCPKKLKMKKEREKKIEAENDLLLELLGTFIAHPHAILTNQTCQQI